MKIEKKKKFILFPHKKKNEFYFLIDVFFLLTKHPPLNVPCQTTKGFHWDPLLPEKTEYTQPQISTDVVLIFD
jgi:hypothetical protein